jgi:hypothetical protein
MEFGDEAQTQSDNGVAADQTVEPAQAKPVRPVGPGVEMIIGGQGEGGVAKRGTLPIVD